MSITTVSSRQFNQEAGKAKKAAGSGPVFITDRGKPSYVLLTYAAYQELSHESTKSTNLADLLYMPGVEDIELEIVGFPDVPRAADFS